LHFGHIEKIEYSGVKVAEQVNNLCKLKFKIAKALHVKEMLHKKKAEVIVKELENDLRKESSDFINFVLKHRENVIEKIKGSEFIRRLRGLGSEIKNKYEQLLNKRLENGIRIKKLLSKSTYDQELLSMTNTKELEKQQDKDLKSLIEDIERYNNLLKDLKAIDIEHTKEHSKLKSVFQVNIQSFSGEGIAFVKHNTSTFTLCYPSIRTYVDRQIKAGFKFPANCSTIEIENLLYVLGGSRININKQKEVLNLAYEINTDDGSIKRLKSFGIPRKRLAVASIRKKELYIMGGDAFVLNDIKTQEFFNTCEKYDIVKNEWSECPKINKPRTNIGAGTFNDRFIYLFGGYNDIDDDMNLIECFDTTNPKEWTIIKLVDNSFWSPIQTMAVVQISEDEMLIYGGMKAQRSVDQSLIFKVNEKKFEKGESMKEADTFLQQHAKTIFMTVFTFGCHYEHLHAFDLKKRTWSLIDYKREYELKSS